MTRYPNISKRSGLINAEFVDSLRIVKFVPAPPPVVFRAWTDPDILKKWWGPKGVRCRSAEIDLCEGGRYRIANEFGDGTIVCIVGEYLEIEKPNRLVYTWMVENAEPSNERVSVDFERDDFGTTVILTHDRIETAALHKQHQLGWMGCFDGLAQYLK